MKVDIKAWKHRNTETIVATVQMSLLGYDPQKGVFRVSAKDADVFYEIESPVALKARLILLGVFSNDVYFDEEADALAFARWLEEAAREAA